MTRTFIQTTEFTKQWELLQLSDDDLRKLELEILQNPQIGSVIPGTGRLRKMRFAYGTKGKRGGVRVCYVDYVVHKTVYLITVYPKSKKDTLTKQECRSIRKMIDILEKTMEDERK